jgi:hypothetical protein
MDYLCNKASPPQDSTGQRVGLTPTLPACWRCTSTGRSLPRYPRGWFGSRRSRGRMSTCTAATTPADSRHRCHLKAHIAPPPFTRGRPQPCSPSALRLDGRKHQLSACQATVLPRLLLTTGCLHHFLAHLTQHHRDVVGVTQVLKQGGGEG